MFDFYTASVLTALLVLIISIADAMTNRLIPIRMKKWSLIACLLIMGAILGEWIGVLTNGALVSFIGIHKLAKLIEFCLAPAIGVAVAMAYGVVKRPRIAIAAVAVHAVFECIAVCFGWVFRVDAQNIYHREGLYVVYVAAFVISIVYVLICLVRCGKQYQAGIDSVLVLTMLLLVVGIVIQFVFSIRIDFWCIAVCNFLLYTRCYKIMLQLDAVTHLLNRRCYDAAIGDMRARAAIVFFDINKFKLVNDTYGHSVGDLCLQHIADQLRAVYGKCGSCYRTGGDEFCVILESNLDRLEELNAQFTAAVETLRKNDERMPGVALGYAYYDPDTSHIQKVIEDADAMMYQNKE